MPLPGRFFHPFLISGVASRAARHASTGSPNRLQS
ncbi:hypothetical protein BP1258A_3966 [Burkholderia pseudomallei 1258a]|uniref:Uncharacterized protein n=1 Tax=Burkholderia pseudomallei (strain 1026b) TaxID=884204 RepID=A0A0H3HUA5_BURP2|nr:hypothetical protein BP1026B_II1217 [Burkholderia pseudomallei 1026b]AFR19466.1 hypothetical protein BPC006_II1539 [Burkholderia pseudomallei BPC006]EIF58522.1 hypothetical protein BP1258A_3966 [Burkholderia pseudomallei 1258a]EIF58914.1 hypothetical protein BP1258B_4371 [Burkholderia pseudomallei 1258b]EIF60249.1 hypothetical protein BP1026A_2899 [Burkholderia pseudomallei 1026a]EIF73329.1 hypothetical protein BP354E_3670 [Burkholderia pseudomallei 354e]EIF77514.1 hypothetical protein BP3